MSNQPQSNQSPRMKNLEDVFSTLILLLWLLAGLYIGMSGLVKVQVDYLKEVAATAPEKPVTENVNGVEITFRSPQDREFVIALDNALNSTFRWTFQVPSPLPHIISALGFGVLGSVVRLLRRVLPKAPFPDLRTLLLRPIFGALIAFLMLGVIALLPSVFTIDQTTLRPSSLLFACFLGGAFAEHVWGWVQSNTIKLLPKPIHT